MNAQKKLDDAAFTIRNLTITKDKQRTELAHTAREIVQLRAENAALREELRKLEWRALDDWDYYCPDCHAYKGRGDGKHEPNCRLAELLK